MTMAKLLLFLSVLARMRLVDDYGKTLVFQRGSDLVEDERELMDRRDDDFFAALQELAQRLGVVRPSNKVPELREGVDVVAYLLVEVDAVGNDDDGVELRSGVGFLEENELVRKPRDRVRLA